MPDLIARTFVLANQNFEEFWEKIGLYYKPCSEDIVLAIGFGGNNFSPKIWLQIIGATWGNPSSFI